MRIEAPCQCALTFAVGKTTISAPCYRKGLCDHYITSIHPAKIDAALLPRLYHTSFATTEGEGWRIHDVSKSMAEKFAATIYDNHQPPLRQTPV